MKNSNNHGLPNSSGNRIEPERQHQQSINPRRKYKTGIYVAFVFLVIFLVMSFVAIAVLSALLFFKKDETIKGLNTENKTERTPLRDPTYHCQKDTPEAEGCGNGWVLSEGSCYWHNDEKLRFDDAEATCRLFGATLTEITDQSETDAVAKFTKGTFWIGAKYLKEDQKSILSCSQTFSQYLDDELYLPGYSGDCALFESSVDSISLTTGDCDDLNESVCEGNYVA